MGPEKALEDRIRIVIGICDEVVTSVIAAPFDGRVLESSSTEEGVEQSQRPSGFVGAVGEQTVVASGDRKTACNVHESKNPQFDSRDTIIHRIPDHADSGKDWDSRQKRGIDEVKFPAWAFLRLRLHGKTPTPHLFEAAYLVTPETLSWLYLIKC